MDKGQPDHRRCSGFTLVELIIVIAIIGILSAVLVPQYIRYVEKSRAAVCLANQKTALQAFQVDLLSSDDTDTDAGETEANMDDAMASVGAEKAGALKYNGICPSGGVITAAFAADGSVTLSCSRHGPAAGPSLAETLASIVVREGNNIRRSGKTLSEYLAKGSVIDSEATTNGEDGSSWRAEVSKLLDKIPGVDSNSSWRLRQDKKSKNYTIYVTAGGKLTAADYNKTVSAIKYVFDAAGKPVSQAKVSVKVTKVSVKSGSITIAYPALSS